MSETNGRQNDYAALKSAVTMEQVLDHYGLLERLRPHGDELRGVCPLHKGSNPEQFHVNRSENVWYCFGDCQQGGTILDFVSRREGVGLRRAAVLLNDWFEGVPVRTHRPRRNGSNQRQRSCFNHPLGIQLKELDERHPYLEERGLTAETVHAFGLGHCRYGLMQGRIVIPIHNVLGGLVAYAGRWPGEPPDGEPKYRLPGGFRKSLELFNLHRVQRADETQPLLVVEGYFDCLKVWQAGHRRVAALMGSRLSEMQAARIIETVGFGGRVQLLFDADASGRNGAETARRMLADWTSVEVINLPNGGAQPDNLSREELRSLLNLRARP